MRASKILFSVISISVILLTGCSNAQSSSDYDFSKIDEVVETAIADTAFPGAVVLAGYKNKVVFEKAYGRFTYSPDSKKMTTDAIFDLASVTKVIATTSAAMLLLDEGKLDLDKKVADYLPDFGNNGKENITIRNLMLHNSGLPAFKRYYTMFESGDEIINDIMNCELIFEPGSKYVYSDLGMITLQKVIEKITSHTIDKFLSERLFSPLGMTSTNYNPPGDVIERCVPTEIDTYWRMDTVKGKVHDENAYQLGGVAGHAGLFSTANDISKVLFTLMNGGVYDGEKYFNPGTIADWTSKQSEQSSRGIGWDTKSLEGYSSAGSRFSANSFGHTGFTGTSVWADKDNDIFIIFLTNRVYPTRENRKIVDVRPSLHEAIFEAVFGN